MRISMDESMKLAQPSNQHQRNDHASWCPGSAVEETINTRLNPLVCSRGGSFRKSQLPGCGNRYAFDAQNLSSVQIPEFAELFVPKSRTETDARKKDSVIFVLLYRGNFSRNFVRVLCATVRDFGAVTMPLNPGKELKTNKRNPRN